MANAILELQVFSIWQNINFHNILLVYIINFPQTVLLKLQNGRNRTIPFQASDIEYEGVTICPYIYVMR